VEVVVRHVTATTNPPGDRGQQRALEAPLEPSSPQARPRSQEHPGRASPFDLLHLLLLQDTVHRVYEKK
jgi:hypothetical protein